MKIETIDKLPEGNLRGKWTKLFDEITTLIAQTNKPVKLTFKTNKEAKDARMSMWTYGKKEGIIFKVQLNELYATKKEAEHEKQQEESN